MDLDQIDGDIARSKALFDALPAHARDPDLARLLQAARELRAYVASIHGPRSDDPMPVFVIKAKDRLATIAVGEYRGACNDFGLADQAAQVGRALDEFHAWRDRNPSLVQVPDHEHVPVGDALQKVPCCCFQHCGSAPE